MNIKKIAYSMAELIVCLLFMCVLAVFSFQALKDKVQDYDASYFNAYNMLRKATYNVFVDSYCMQDVKTDAESVCNYDAASNTFEARPFPTTTNELCTRLNDYLNATSASCALDDIALDSPISDDISPRLIVNSTYKFYMASNSGAPFTITDDDGKSLNFFIVWIDINGDRMPNSLNEDKNHGTLPDIVPFAVTEFGDVLPIGYPAYKSGYMTVRLKLPSTYCAGGKKASDRTQRCSSFLKEETFAQAVYHAYGKKQYVDMPQTLHFTERLKQINAESKTIADIKDDIDNVKNMNNSEIEQYRTNYNCEEGQYACVVTIDEYFTRKI